ncbi:choice-of-anchor L domain-containing protein [Vaginella massiliensis]|uniref:choice-of-anchor L domain-containing protein n=1 Tax=Vaginella massiliensis TaxID=1816680 RepID=UPI000A565736|nr:choice-of-anchor L domain-containing protein [Vaginella massiliensis]
MNFIKPILLLSFFTLSLSISKAQYLNVSGEYTDEKLIKDIFIGNENRNCITVENIKITGWDFGENDKSYGYFEKGSLDFPIEKGILLTTGRLKEAVGPNNKIISSTSRDWKGDEDLERALNISNSTNATILEFEFTMSKGTRISFDYLFASEEYLGPGSTGNCSYSDGFVFLIKKADTDEPYKNLAVLPNTTIPVSVNTVNGPGGRCAPVNPQFFDRFNPFESPTNFNGQTKMLTATTEIEPDTKYHLKIVIADHNNGYYDSGVFLRSGSFTGHVDLGPDLFSENEDGLCPDETHTIDASIDGATAYQWYKDGELLKGANNPQLEVFETGYYEVEILLDGCILKGNKTVEVQPVPEIKTTTFSICDDDFDGNYAISLRDYLHEIISNYTYGMYIKFYEKREDAENDDENDLDQNEYLFDSVSQTIFARIQSGRCPVKIVPITLEVGFLSEVEPIPPTELCDEDLDGKIELDIDESLTDFFTDLEYSPTYYLSESDAKNGINSINTIIISSDTDIYVRYKQPNRCENIMKVEFLFKQGKKTELLSDQMICNGTTTTLDAGEDFDSYLWLHNGATTSSIENVAAGSYQVRLEWNGCFYTQTVEVKEIEEISIDLVDIQGSTVTVIASGGNIPYRYALDGGSFQSSNVFTNVSLGMHTVYVKSSTDDCNAVERAFSVIQLSNAITPNGDGLNDVLDYAQLLQKTNPKLTIYDRYGMVIFEGNQQNQFIWDAKLNGIPLETGSYWYVVEWTEPTSNQHQKVSGSILLKNK